MDSVTPKMLEKFQNMIYPEVLEQFSKVTTIIAEDLSFKVEDLFQLKDCQKITTSKEVFLSLVDTLVQSNIITLNESKTEGKILLSDSLVIYSFVNIPYDYSRDDVISLFKLEKEDYIRLYKLSLFWILASETPQFNQDFEKKYLKTIKVEDNCPLKYNITSSNMLKNAIGKMIQQYTYMRETNDLTIKGDQQSPPYQMKRDSNKKIAPNTNDDMSWRKKSDASDQGFGYKSKYNQNKRKRFKSDPNEFNYRIYEPQKDATEIEIDLKNLKYPLEIKYKYSNKEMIDFYEKIKESLKTEDKLCINSIEEIHYMDRMKQLFITDKENYFNSMPKNNPLLNFNMKK